jgi:hypothetical protein
MPDVQSRGKSHLFEINGYYRSHSVEEIRSGKFLASFAILLAVAVVAEQTLGETFPGWELLNKADFCGS